MLQLGLGRRGSGVGWSWRSVSSAYDREVIDRKPPRPIADERTTLFALLNTQCESLISRGNVLCREQVGGRAAGSGMSLVFVEWTTVTRPLRPQRCVVSTQRLA